jgi:hypothetical protein
MVTKPIKKVIKEDEQKDKQPLFNNFYTRFIALFVYILLTIIGCWLSYLLYKWLINKLYSWSPTIAFIVTVVSFIWSIIGIVFYQIFAKIFLVKADNVRHSRLDEFVGFLIFFGRDLVAFLIYFISFAYLCWEIQSIWGQQFSGNVSSVNSYIAFAFENAIDIVESDVLEIYGINLSDIEPISFLGKNIVFFFRLFIKLVALGFVIRIIRYLFHAD